MSVLKLESKYSAYSMTGADLMGVGVQVQKGELLASSRCLSERVPSRRQRN
jgi:hypothetical protein